MSKEKDLEFQKINKIQDEYIDDLSNIIEDPLWVKMKRVDFKSPTGTGKTKMMSKLINKFPGYYFVITTLSKGGLQKQTRNDLNNDCKQDNWFVYGTADYRINSKLEAEDIINKIPKGMKCIWIRDEGHIRTNRFDELLEKICYKVINFSATPILEPAIDCNFTDTLMLRTVHQQVGTPEQAIEKLMEVKKNHKKVPNYNPCAIFRCIKDDPEIMDRLFKACDKYKLKYINITTDDFDMTDICKDDNKYDVIINKFKIVEGINIKRAHVLYMDNQPGNIKTTIQVIGRCRRNALLYNEFPNTFSGHPGTGIDICDPKNKKLLNDTVECYVFYNQNFNLTEDEAGELQYAFCNIISCQAIKLNRVIEVENGRMPNGLYVIELKGKTGKYKIVKDEKYGFNVVKPLTEFYKEKHKQVEPCIFTIDSDGEYRKVLCKDFEHFLIKDTEGYFDEGTGRIEFRPINLCYSMNGVWKNKIEIDFNQDILEYFKANRPKLTKTNLKKYVNFNYDGSEIKHYTFVNLVLRRQYKDKETIEKLDKSKVTIGTSDIDHFYELVYRSMKNIKLNNIDDTDIDMILDDVNENLDLIEQDLSQEKVKVILRCQIDPTTLNKYKKRCSDFEIKLIESNTQPIYETNAPLNAIHNYKNYDKTINDYESAMLGVESFHAANVNGTAQWFETKAVSSKIGNYNKFNKYISMTYEKELETAKEQLFSGSNNFKIDKRCNSMIGYCVEYYSKYLVYGDDFLGYYINKVMKETKATEINDGIIIKACIQKYRENMSKTYSSSSLGSLIRTVSVNTLVQDNYRYFVKLIVKLGTQTAEFVKKTLYPSGNIINNIDPNLSIEHIAGLADYITEDTILDIKTTNSIGEGYIRQVLAYHYLSTKRSDLHIKRVIVYDATSGRSVIVPISEKNLR